MLATMPAAMFNLDFSSPHRPAVPSQLSSSPLRPSQNSPPPSPRRQIQSSPIQGPPLRFKYASRNAKPNPLRLSRDKAQESRRSLFLKNVCQRSEDKKWQRRGGDQEALKLEWNVLNKRWRRQKDMDIDGIVFEDELDDIPENPQQEQREVDGMMVDAIARQEEAELNAMLSLLGPGAASQPQQQHDTNSVSDDEDYDALFMDILSHQGGNDSGLTLPGQMDLS
ncbi:hypothetical protein GGR50DRAFT_425294 [Xylaria sp. CBS 124048]|nr:hypothetical protein GGR50DRAFT_425294 [Xylaria sp. CBS 124048]